MDHDPEAFFAKYKDDLFSHMISVSIYTPLCFFFPLKADSNNAAIIEKLSRGCEKLSQYFPWLTGQVVRGSHVHGEPIDYRLTLYEKSCELKVKDYSSDKSTPLLADFRKARFPCNMIDGETLTSLVGVPNSPEGVPSPIFFIQANFLKDGLILSFAGEHSVMDGHGVGQVIRLFSKSCNAEAFTPDELIEGNRVGKGLIEFLPAETYKPGAELDFLVDRPEAIDRGPGDSHPPTCSWTFVRFSSSNIAKLKTMAAASTSDKENCATYVTSNDAVTALIWQCVSRSRIDRFSKRITTTIGRAVDVRSSLSISPSYLGNMSNHAYTTMDLADVASASLDKLAMVLRSALNPDDIAYGLRSLATYVARMDDRSHVHYGANMNFSHDLFVSSWAKLPSYDHTFGLGLGLPEAVRRPGFLAIEGLIYLLPMDKHHGIEAMICLRNEDLRRLQNDKHFSAYSEWIG